MEVINSSKLITLGLSGQLKVYDVSSGKVESEFNVKEINL